VPPGRGASPWGYFSVYTEVVLTLFVGYDFYWGGLGNTLIYLIGDLMIFMVVCIAIGVLFPLLRQRLPGETDRVKAMVLFVPTWSVFTVISAFVLVVSFGQSLLPYYELWVLVLILVSIPYGYLLGYLWEREEPTEV
jgi:ABC-type polysaccharide transport system permease subunit